MTKADPEIDFSRITFPSDKLTFEMVRRASWSDDPLAFDHALLEGDDGKAFGNLSASLSIERELAQKAFKAALGGYKPNRIGKREKESARDRREMNSALDQAYQHYGLATGSKQSLLLIRDIEQQAVSQANEFLGKTR